MNPTELILLRGVVQVAMFSLAAALVYFAARRLGPRVAAASLLWGLTLVLGLSIMVASPWPRWADSTNPTQEAPQATPLAAATPAATPAVAISDGDAPEIEVVPSVATGTTFASYSAALFEALTQPQPVAVVEPGPWRGWAIWIVAAGVLYFAARLVIGLFAVKRLRRRSEPLADTAIAQLIDQTKSRLGITQKIDIRQSSHIVTPATVGWRQPVVLLPENWRDWNSEERTAVIAHELAHVAGRDYLGWVVARLAVAIHFYNPLVRWLASRLQLEQELAADQTAARLTGDSKQYLHSLASLALATPAHRAAGPVRTLIPSRSLLLRRVEMLRSPFRGVKNAKLAALLQWAAGAMLLLLAVAVAGFRAPVLAQQPGGEGGERLSYIEIKPAERIPLEFVPKETVYAISVRPAQAAAADGKLGAISQKLTAMAPELAHLKLNAKDIAEAAIFVPGGSANERWVIRTTAPQSCSKLVADLAQHMQKVQGEMEHEVWKNDVTRVKMTRFDDTTFLLDRYVHGGGAESTPPLNTNPIPAWAEKWQARSGDAVVGVFDVLSLLSQISENDRKHLFGDSMIQTIAPVMDHVVLVSGGVTLGDALSIEVTANTDDPEAAPQVAATLSALKVLGANVLQKQRRMMQARVELGNTRAMALPAKLFSLAEVVLQKITIETQGRDVRVAYQDEGQIGKAVELATAMLPSVQQARATARRVQSTNNLKHLALAMHNYHDMYGHLPRSSNYEYRDRATGKTLRSPHPHSWRVALLPLLEQTALYDRYRFDQPWDSPANSQLLKHMPTALRDPASTGDPFNSPYFVLLGPLTAFPSDRSIGFRHITDGTSNTVMFVEAKRDIPWTKPEDIPFTVDGPMPKLGGHHDGLILAAFCDGSVTAIQNSIAPEVLKKFITRNGSEVAERNDLNPPPAVPVR